MRLARFVVACVAALMLSGCATGTRLLTEQDQKDRYAKDQEAARKICAAYKTTGCPLTRIVVVEALPGDRSAQVNGATGEIQIVRSLYIVDPDWVKPPEAGGGLSTDLVRRAVLAHELQHLILGHRGRCSGQAGAACEIEANNEGVKSLEIGWGMSRPDAIKLMMTWLSRYELTKGGRGHAAGCEEIRAFAAAYGLAVPAACGGAA